MEWWEVVVVIVGLLGSLLGIYEFCRTRCGAWKLVVDRCRRRRRAAGSEGGGAALVETGHGRGASDATAADVGVAVDNPVSQQARFDAARRVEMGGSTRAAADPLAPPQPALNASSTRPLRTAQKPPQFPRRSSKARWPGRQQQ